MTSHIITQLKFIEFGPFSEVVLNGQKIDLCLFDCFSLYEGAVLVNISCDMSKLLFSTSKTCPKQNMVYLNQKPEFLLKREEVSRDEISLKSITCQYNLPIKLYCLRECTVIHLNHKIKKKNVFVITLVTCHSNCLALKDLPEKSNVLFCVL